MSNHFASCAWDNMKGITEWLMHKWNIELLLLVAAKKTHLQTFLYSGLELKN